MLPPNHDYINCQLLTWLVNLICTYVVNGPTTDAQWGPCLLLDPGLQLYFMFCIADMATWLHIAKVNIVGITINSGNHISGILTCPRQQWMHSIIFHISHHLISSLTHDALCKHMYVYCPTPCHLIHWASTSCHCTALPMSWYLTHACPTLFYIHLM